MLASGYRIILTLPRFFSNFLLNEHGGIFRKKRDTLEASIWDVWMVEPWVSTLVMNLQILSRPLEGFKTRSTLHKNSLENTKCPIQEVIDFAIKTVLQISHSHVCHVHIILFDSVILIYLNDVEQKQWTKSQKYLFNYLFISVTYF